MYFEKLEDRFLLSTFDIILYQNPVNLNTDYEFIVNFDPRDIKNYLASDIIMLISDESYSVGDHHYSYNLPKNSNSSNNSALMLGSIYVEIVLFESNGNIDQNISDWTEEQVINIRDETIEGFKWIYDTYKKNFPYSKVPLTFIINFKYLKDPVSTGYEMAKGKPIILYQTEFLKHISYEDSESNSYSKSLLPMREYLMEKRESLNYDYAFSVFVSNDQGKGLRESGKAILGGPFAVLSYGNAGYGIKRFSAVLAHETFHIFNALDEYPNSFSYYNTSGYYGIQNTNAFDSHPRPALRSISLMSDFITLNQAYKLKVSSVESFQAIGWRDTDNDGIFDAYDSDIKISVEVSIKEVKVKYSVIGIKSKIHNVDITKMTADILQVYDGTKWKDFLYTVNEYSGEIILSIEDFHYNKLRIKNIEYNVYSNVVII
jgi:hypothetical protein